MPDSPKPPEWKHDQQISFDGMKELLNVIKGRLESTLVEKKAELTRLVGARDSLRK